jgi:hypothetical protein
MCPFVCFAFQTLRTEYFVTVRLLRLSTPGPRPAPAYAGVTICFVTASQILIFIRMTEAVRMTL